MADVKSGAVVTGNSTLWFAFCGSVVIQWTSPAFSGAK